MKKIIFSIFLLIFSLCLVGCNKVRSEEDKRMFDEYFSNIDSIVDYKKVEYYLTFIRVIKLFITVEIELGRRKGIKK